jgi:c-di-GMP-binding flagellar brake protein YcgR
MGNRYLNKEKGKVFLEKRKYSRLKDFIFISCHFKEEPLKEFKAVTQNISGGGLMFECERRIAKGIDLGIDLYQPTNSFKTLIFVISIAAKVVWMQKIKHGFFELGANKYRMGIEFTNIKEKDKEIIMQYIADNVK